MASIQEQLKNARTLEDIINLLTILFTNMNNQNEIYYDMFINPEPMDLELERYNEDGVLETIIVPNRAKDRISIYSGPVDPNGYQAARIGALYINTVSKELFYKAYGDSKEGWSKVWTKDNLDQLSDINTDASELVQLNINATEETLAVAHGGTGTKNISGLIKGNGTSPFSVAQPGIDYMEPTNFVGMIAFYPGSSAPSGWVACDGASYPINDGNYSNLYAVIGDRYKLPDDPSDEFRVPNLIGKYIKCDLEAGVEGEAQVGAHEHSLSGQVSSESEHTHGPGNLNVNTSYFSAGHYSTAKIKYKGAFSKRSSSAPGDDGTNNNEATNMIYNFNLAGNWNPATATAPGSSHTHSLDNLRTDTYGEGQTNEVAHVTMLPIIKL